MYQDEPEATNDMRQAQEEEAEQLEHEWQSQQEADAETKEERYWWKHLDMDEDYIRGYDDGEQPESNDESE